jgi:hypothetical protein
MKYALIFCLGLLGLSSVYGQTRADLVQCFELAFEDPQMQELMNQEWGEVRTVYMVQDYAGRASATPFGELFKALDPQDFLGFPYEVVLVTAEMETALRAERNDASRSVLAVGGFIREQKLSLNIGGPLPGNPRESMVGSFVFEKSDGQWKVIQSYVQKNP